MVEIPRDAGGKTASWGHRRPAEEEGGPAGATGGQQRKESQLGLQEASRRVKTASWGHRRPTEEGRKPAGATGGQQRRKDGQLGP